MDAAGGSKSGGCVHGVRGKQIHLLAGSEALFLPRRNSAGHVAEEGKGLGVGREKPAHWTFRKPAKVVKAKVEEVESWVRGELGDVRAFSLDSPSSTQKRIDALNAAAGYTRGTKQ